MKGGYVKGQGEKNTGRSMAERFEIWIATGFGLGYAPIASGTVGSLGGVLLYGVLHPLPWPIYLITVVALAFLGVWSADRAERIFQKKDCGYIVIDEIVGFMISAFLIPWKWPWLLAAFMLFRIFDVLKPFPLRRAELLPGGVGILLDDVGAGLYTNILLHIIRIWLMRT
jgi:phosphatidylglycerophosphatase A